MDQMETGKFIAQERKGKHLTQQQLAQRLGISNRTVSKWECGNGFPEVSLLLPLCQELGVSVNELLSGRRLQAQDYRKEAEEHMIDFMREREENLRRFWLATLTGIIATVSFLTLLLVACVYGGGMPFALRAAVVGIAVAVFAVGMYVAMQGERSIGYFQCKHCATSFVPSWKTYMLGPTLFTAYRYMPCPHCGRRSWCRKTMGRGQAEE